MTTASEGVRAELDRHGLVYLPNFLPSDRIQAAREAVFRALREHDVLRDDGWHFEHLAHEPPNRQVKPVYRQFKKAPILQALISHDLVELVAEIQGEAVAPMLDWPQLLLSYPNASDWAVPTSTWHTDLPAIPNRGRPGIQVFTFLESLGPRGGGTAVVVGSHRLNDGLPVLGSKQIKRRLQREPYFQELFSRDNADRNRFLEPRRVGNVDLQVRELVGEPGDLYLMDLRLLHALAPNTSNKPRIMVSQRFLGERAKADFTELVERYRAEGHERGAP